MPKKFQGENSKAVVAKARKAEKAASEKEAKLKAEEDAAWREDDKLICKKIQRKEEKERKKLDDSARRQERKLLVQSEEFELEPKAPPKKVTAHQLMKQRDDAKATITKETEVKTHLDAPLVENLNLLADETISASGIDAAVAAMSMNADSTPDRHPEKRMAAAYKAFESNRLPQLKKENPTMRLTQLKQLLRKEWQKHPHNPLNQRAGF